MSRRPLQSSDGTGPGVSRRSLMAGAGAGVAAMAVGVVGAPMAQAAQKPPGNDGSAESSAVTPDRSTIPTSIASSPTSGWIYRTKSMYAFRPFDPAGQVTWGGQGVYPAGTSTSLRAEFAIPAGALVRELEFYVYNMSANSLAADALLYTPGRGLVERIGSVSIMPMSEMAPYRLVIPSDGFGPYQLGSSMLASIQLPTDGSAQINGARVGFSNGAGTVGPLDKAVRAYDSRSGDGPIAAGTTRTVTLPSNVVLPGVASVFVNVTAVNPTASGILKVYPATGTAPSAPAVNFTTATGTTNGILVGVSSGRRVRIFASATTHVVLDVTGTVG